jgi:hypothetical protein
MNINTLESTVRQLGYQLAVREMQGDNGFHYYKIRKQHNFLLNKLNRLNKVT